MTPEILKWLEMVREVYLPQPGRVLEVGSLNVNGTPRSAFEAVAESYTGTDMQAGDGVDMVVNNGDLLDRFRPGTFDTVICCECLEHDRDFLDTVYTLQNLVQASGHLIITTPTFGFPLHRYPKDYWRFGEDAYREVFFAGMDILDLRHLDSADGKNTTIAGLARKV